MDTRTQANLSKLNSSRKQELNVVTEHFNDIIQRRQILGTCSYNYSELFLPSFFEYKKDLNL